MPIVVVAGQPQNAIQTLKTVVFQFQFGPSKRLRSQSNYNKAPTNACVPLRTQRWWCWLSMRVYKSMATFDFPSFQGKWPTMFEDFQTGKRSSIYLIKWAKDDDPLLIPSPGGSATKENLNRALCHIHIQIHV